MSYVLTIYSKEIYQDFILPAIDNADYTIVLQQKIFSLSDDVLVRMEIVDGEWRFVQGENYRIVKNGKSYIRKGLHNGEALNLELFNTLNFAVMIQEKTGGFTVYKKYLLPPEGKIYIGKNKDNHICYDSMGLVSGIHASIEMNHMNYILRDMSRNGVYVNHNRIKQMHVLQYGDTINIIGMKMVFLGNFLALEKPGGSFRIKEDVIVPLESGDIMDAVIAAAPDPVSEKKKKYFNRIPRNLKVIDVEPYVIEGPPGKDNSRRAPWYLTVGPALTMAIPMTLGCVLSIVGSGSNSSVFMYTGLITAFGSAVLGAVWGGVRLKYDAKVRVETEAHRTEAYAEYLTDIEKKIEEQYEKDIQILNDRYPSADMICALRDNNSTLWNRNVTHADFMYHRLGIGALPFPSPVNIPPERFMLYKDALADRPEEIRKKFEKMQDVPICVDLLSHSLIGVLGGSKKQGAYEVIRVLLTQIAAANSYTDVKMVLTYNKNLGAEQECFRSFRWFPHTWSTDRKFRFVADEPEEVADVYYELTQLLRERKEEKAYGEEKAPLPLYVLVVSDISMLNNELISKYVFDKDPQLGLITIILAEKFEDLPNSCEYIIANEHDGGKFTGVYSVRGEEQERISVCFDNITNASVESFARKLSDIEVEEMQNGGEIPSSVTFFDMMGISKLEELDVATRWAKNRTYDSIRGLLGKKAGGNLCYLDVHEKYHGPHGLIAGTTGSGKSETLQSYMLSLAINYSPDDIGFFIIDYKGGGMANLFSGLPHMMGQISNLSGNQIHRAMVSIKSENRRRQQIFNDYGVNNINAYTKLIKSNEAQTPVPHLFIIIDEFAELKREEPDFMRELISVAQVGRSLGVHLILATQKPSGTVDDNIWSNSKFRLCLRVQDKQDSNDMLHKPDAAYITQAGRGYLQVGNDELYELFQSGYSGAPYDEDGGDNGNETVRMMTIHGRTAIVGNRMKMHRQEKAKAMWLKKLVEAAEQVIADGNTPEHLLNNPVLLRQCAEKVTDNLIKNNVNVSSGENGLQRMENIVRLCCMANDRSTGAKVDYIIQEESAHSVKIPETKQKTQLDAVVEYLGKVAKERGYDHEFLLWLPVLPENLYLEELSGYCETTFNAGSWPTWKKWNLKAPIGLCDDPVNQAQRTLEIDFAAMGHLIVIGSVGTGKSVFLQSLAYSLIHRYSPEYVNLYCIDFSSNAMRGFEKSAHVGGVMYEHDTEKISRFFNMLTELMEERKKLFKGGNYEQYVQAMGVKVPAVFVFIDQYSSFREKTGNIYEEQMVHLSRDGAACGIYLVISAAGFGLTEISNNVGRNIKNVICLEMGDKFQYMDLLHTMQIEVLPETGVKGRGLVKQGDVVLEYQTALAVKAEDDYSRIEKIEKECLRLNAAWHGKKAKQVPVIPDEPVLDEFIELDAVKEQLQSGHLLPIGYDADNANPYALDLHRIFSYLISGRAKTGKKNLLKILMKMGAQTGMKMYVADFSGKLKEAAAENNAVFIDTDRKMYDAFMEWQTEIIEKNGRKKEMEAAGKSDLEIYQEMASMGLSCMMISNLPEFINHIMYPEKDVPLMAGFLENITEKGAGLGIYFISAYTPDEITKVKGNAIYNNLVKKKEGLHLGGNVGAQNILNFDYISYKEQNKVQKTGVAMLPSVDGELTSTRLIIPLAGKADAEK